ncbi:hypothetical protein niasHT_018742 [Heterodera trifolii]|uniref:Uncharacterized protein n=1 Tax=Heterodera trifolii TaxID=157864 RepID=A0ABD2LBG4_9BILA
MAPPNRQNKFHADYEREFQGIKRSKKGDEYANCVPCNFDINLKAMGKAAILAHHKRDKHKQIASNVNVPSNSVFHAEYVCSI